MAGDWMKMEKCTPDKPEVFAIADSLNIDPDAVFGKCFRVWGWFDDHTTNGKSNGTCVSKTLIDRLTGVNGFSNAMINVGWLVVDGDGVAAHNFERHNGETSKQRALTAKRVAKHTNAKLTPNALPREEKRREEITTTPDGVSDSVFQDFVKLRQGFKAPITPTALKGLQREATKANMTLEAVMEVCCKNGWRGFEASWIKAAPSKPLDLPREGQTRVYKGEQQTYYQMVGWTSTGLAA